MFRLVLFFVVLMFAPSGYFIWSSGRDAVIDDLVAASQKDDVAAFAERVDFDAVRAFLKQDLNRQRTMPLFQGVSAGLSEQKISEVVDYYVQPENIDILYYYHEQVFENLPERDFIHSITYTPPYGFSVTVGFPKTVSTSNAQGDAAAIAAARDRFKVRAVFALDGLTFKMKELHVPIFMTPRHVYSTPAVKVFGRRDVYQR